MKVLIDHSSPFLLAHGGFQLQIEQTKHALEELGVEVEFLRWWDAKQTGDIIHFFGAASVDYLLQSRGKSLRVVQTPLFTETCNRSDLRLKIQGAVVRGLLAMPGPVGVKRQLLWKSFVLADMNVVGLEAERRVLEWVYGVPRDHISVVPLGLSREFLSAGPTTSRGDALICVGTVTGRKNTVPLARMAREVEVPVIFVGGPYHERDPYWIEFLSLIDNRWVQHQAHVANANELINLYHGARGAVVMSRYENWCLAAHEAAACGLPLLLPDLKWSRECFGNDATYFQGDDPKTNLQILRSFYNAAPSLSAPRRGLYSWHDVAKRLIDLYRDVLQSTARKNVDLTS